MPYTAAQLTTFYTRINLGQVPDATTTAQIQTAATQNAAGQITDAQALNTVLDGAQVRATTDVAAVTYQFFTTAIPSQAGFNFLVNNPGTGFNTSYYNGATGTATSPGAGGFNLENRYFNAAINLGANPAGQSFQSFVNNYGSVSLQTTINVAYESIVGAGVVGQAQATAGIAAITASIPYFQRVAAERAPQFNQDLATKAIIVGYILEEAVKADVGNYARALDQFNASLAAGSALFSTNLLTTYAMGGAGFNSGIGGNALNNGDALGAGTTTNTNAPAGSTVNLAGVAANGFATVNAANNTTFVLSSAIAANNGQLIVAVTDATTTTSTADTLTFAYRNQTTAVVSSVVADGVETINVDAQLGAGAPAGSTLSFDVSDAALRTLNITGNETVVFAAAQYATVVGGQVIVNGGALTTVNASGTTGGSVIDVTFTTGTQAGPVTVVGGSGVDTVFFKDATLVTGGGGSDVYAIYAPTSGGSYSSISDETAGEALQFRTAGGAVSRVTAFNGTPLNLGTGSSLQQSLDAASSSSTTAGSVSVFRFGGDTFVVQDNSPSSSTFQGGVDVVVRLVGIHDLAGSTIGTGMFAGALVTSG